MDKKVIYVNFSSTSRKSKSNPQSNEHKIIKQKKSFFDMIIDKCKALFGTSGDTKCLKKADPHYKYWL
ncbi:hypothetical protein [Clostridium sp. ZS2-4]|uniref:hypothetical protein n=1 Tax=Clostridium sp. ZS2-4 TaxID=2987703 RepID=UPI00227BCA35|nr:hypothetical protein [Clostridium sp. ZS2-4]MCY6354917.1 hypothetical protein [Clostridium sp. ZS2-4]